MRHDEIKPCPFHGCIDVGVIRSNGFAFVMGLSCSARGSAYSLKTCGEDMAADMAIQDWNEREKHIPENGESHICRHPDVGM